MKKILLFMYFLNILNISRTFKLCVIGGSSGLGRELIFQSLEKDTSILALTSNPDAIKVPYRGGGLSEKKCGDFISNKNLIIDYYSNFVKYNFTNIIFTTNAPPFKIDYSDILTQTILSNKLDNLKNIILISAYGAGDTINDANMGFKIMNNWYLKDVYRAKNRQESLINDYCEKYNIKSVILRPKVLSYGPNLYSAKSRQTFAEEILSSYLL